MYTKIKKRVKISTDLLSSTIHFLDDLDIDYFDPETMQMVHPLMNWICSPCIKNEKADS